MQNTYRFPQLNNYVVNPVYYCQLGFIADGKILHCGNLIFDRDEQDGYWESFS